MKQLNEVVRGQDNSLTQFVAFRVLPVLRTLSSSAAVNPGNLPRMPASAVAVGR